MSVLCAQRHACHDGVHHGRPRDDAAQLLVDLEWTVAHGAGINVMTHDVGLPVSRGGQAFGRGRYVETVAALEPARAGSAP